MKILKPILPTCMMVNNVIFFYFAGDVPDSCCKQETATDGCGKGAMGDSTKIYTNGCFTQFEEYIAKNAGAAAGVGVGVIVLLFLGICVACCVGKGLAKERQYV